MSIDDKIEKKIKEMKEELEWGLAGVSDKVYYDVRDMANEVEQQISQIHRDVDQQVREQIENGKITPMIMEKIKNEVIKQIVGQVIKEYDAEIRELKNQTNDLVTKITASIMSRLENNLES